MKLANLNETLKPIEPLPDVLNAKMPTFRVMYRSALGNAVGSEATQSVRLFQLEEKLRGDAPEIEITDDEALLLRAACLANPARWVAHYHAQVLISLPDLPKEEKIEVVP